jgi:arylformamidase
MYRRQSSNPTMTNLTPEYFEAQYNNRALVPEHPQIIARWVSESAKTRATARCELDLEYGTSFLEKLDLFFPEAPSKALLVFIHGGYWRSLDKNDFSFLASAFTKQGITVAMINYGLAPQLRIDDIVRQSRVAVAWLAQNARRYGADASKLYIAGHSAGAHLAAMMAATHWPSVSTMLPIDLVKGAICISGIYDLDPLRFTAVNQDVRLDEAAAKRLSPALMQPPVKLPMLMGVGGDESDEFKRQNKLLVERWSSVSAIQDIPLPGTNHFSVVEELANAESPMHRAALAMMGVK